MLLLPHPGHREGHRRGHLLLVLDEGFRLLHQIDDAAGLDAAEGVEHASGHMGQGQEADLLIGVVNAVDALQVAHHEDHVPLADHGALGRAGGAGSVGEDHQILRFSRIDRRLPFRPVVLAVGGAERDQLRIAHALRVAEVAQPLHVENDDLLKGRRAFPDFEHLVELLLVLGEVEAGAAVVDQVGHLLRGIRGIDAVGDAADAVHAEVGEQPLLADFAGDGAHVAALKTQGLKPQSHQAGLLAVVGPTCLVPDAKVLLPERHLGAPVGHPLPKELRHRGAAVNRQRRAHRQVFLCFQRRRPRTPSSFMPK